MRTLIVLASVLFASSAIAGELPKEGKYSGDYYSSGSFVVAAMNKEATAGVRNFDEVGVTVGSGILDHMTWRCMGEQGGFAEKVRATGMCVATDLGGDQIVGDFVASPVPLSDKERRGKFEFVGGTGKYVGITGAFTFINYPYEMPYSDLAAANHYAAHNTYEGTYKLP